MPRLSVNLNKAALVRNARGPGARPDVAALGRLALGAGADGLTLHPRPDGRHARASDVLAFAALCRAPGAELNVEGNPFEAAAPAADAGTGDEAFPGFLALVARARPHQVTLVPDAHGQRTSDHGWALGPDEVDRLAPVVAALRAQGARVSLFLDPDPDAVARAATTGADAVELFTGPYAEAAARGEGATGTDAALLPYVACAEAARDAGLRLHAGHDLDLANLAPFVAAVPGVAEVSIGQALVADALEVGLPAAVAAYLTVLRGR